MKRIEYMQTKECYIIFEKDTRIVISLRMALFAASSPAMSRWKKCEKNILKRPGLNFLMIKQQQEKAFFLIKVACGEWKGVRKT